MKTNYTPGPWAYDKDRHRIISTSQNLWEAEDGEEAEPRTVIQTLGGMGGENPDADIALIVEAPEILRLLEQSTAALSSLVGKPRPEFLPAKITEWHTIILDAQQAINKATQP